MGAVNNPVGVRQAGHESSLNIGKGNKPKQTPGNKTSWSMESLGDEGRLKRKAGPWNPLGIRRF